MSAPRRRAARAGSFADVWGTRDLVAAGIVLAALSLAGLGRLIDVPALVTAGIVAAVAGMVVLIAWRLIGGPDRRRDHDEWV
jgi:hypothetical protein